MKKSILSLLLACFLQINLAFAQNVMKGVVSDANGPLVGVVIHDKDNAKGTTSDMSGKYALNGAESGHTIEFRYLGYVTETVVWDGKSVVNIKLKEDAVQLEETVVIGYGSVKKKDLTGAVGVINSSLIEKQSTSQLSQSLQGLIPGLTVTRSSSMPGASATVQVRGVTTMSDSSPLILVDGMMVSSLDNIASEDVQQITVLKDAASASIYGARAAAGVILITTKEATEGQLSIGYNGEISLSSPTEFPKFLTDPYHYMTMYNEWSWNDAGNPAGGEFANYSQDYIDNYATNNRYDPIQYPIYDWKTTDVWTANGKFQWDYNVLYDLYYRAGVNLERQRVASPFINEAQESLQLYRVLDPNTWGKMVGRVNGVNFTGMYGGTHAMGWQSVKLPEGYTWREFMYFLLSTLPERARKNYLRKLSVSVNFWRTKGGCLSDATIQKLIDAKVPIIVMDNSNYKTLKKPVRMEYQDDIDIPEFKEIPTYKRMCVCILKNDHACKYMGFSPTKEEMSKRSQIMEQYRIIVS